MSEITESTNNKHLKSKNFNNNILIKALSFDDVKMKFNFLT